MYPTLFFKDKNNQFTTIPKHYLFNVHSFLVMPREFQVPTIIQKEHTIK